MIRRPPRSTQSRSSAASDVYKRQPPAVPRFDAVETGHLAVYPVGTERLGMVLRNQSAVGARGGDRRLQTLRRRIAEVVPRVRAPHIEVPGVGGDFDAR